MSQGYVNKARRKFQESDHSDPKRSCVYYFIHLIFFYNMCRDPDTFVMLKEDPLVKSFINYTWSLFGKIHMNACKTPRCHWLNHSFTHSFDIYWVSTQYYGLFLEVWWMGKREGADASQAPADIPVVQLPCYLILGQLLWVPTPLAREWVWGHLSLCCGQD